MTHNLGKLSGQARGNAALVFVVVGFLWAGAGCNDQQQAIEGPTWKEFRASAYEDPQTGYLLADGDLMFRDEDEMRDYFEGMASVRKQRDAQDANVTGQSLVVGTMGLQDAMWSPTLRYFITYCVSKDFGVWQPWIAAFMDIATKDWQETAAVRFIYVPSEDARCTADNPSVLLNVVPASGGKFAGAASFPFYQRSTLWIDWVILGTHFNFNYVISVFKHELGHVLGFHHEHVRLGCTNEGTWRPITSYDPNSIMHYTWLCGVSYDTAGKTLSPLDRLGAGMVYRKPDVTFTAGRSFPKEQACLGTAKGCKIDHDNNAGTSPISQISYDQFWWIAPYVKTLSVTAKDSGETPNTNARFQVLAQLSNGSMSVIWTSPNLPQKTPATYNVPVNMNTTRIRIQRLNSAVRLDAYTAYYGFAR